MEADALMPTFTVKQASHKKDVPGKHGPMKVLTLQLSGPEGDQTAEWFTKHDTALPEPGSSIEGTVEPSEYGLKFKKAAGQFGGGFRGRSPEENRRIVRQHSQDMGIRWAELAHARGKLPEDFKVADLLKLVDVFHKDAMEGGA